MHRNMLNCRWLYELAGALIVLIFYSIFHIQLQYITKFVISIVLAHLNGHTGDNIGTNWMVDIKQAARNGKVPVNSALKGKYGP